MLCINHPEQLVIVTHLLGNTKACFSNPALTSFFFAHKKFLAYSRLIVRYVCRLSSLSTYFFEGYLPSFFSENQ